MARPHQPDESAFRAILPEDIEWKAFPAFPPGSFVSERNRAPY